MERRRVRRNAIGDSSTARQSWNSCRCVQNDNIFPMRRFAAFDNCPTRARLFGPEQLALHHALEEGSESVILRFGRADDASHLLPIGK